MQTEGLGKKIKKYRRVQDLTQEDLGEKAGLHYTYIGQVERGEKEPSFKALKKIAEALDIGVDKLLINYELSSDVTLQISNITDLLLNRSQKELEMIYTLLKNLIEIIDTQPDVEKKE